MVTRRPQHTPVRRAQLIAPFGPGALVVLDTRVTAIVTGPRTWLAAQPPRNRGTSSVLDDMEIHDRRLEEALGVRRLITPWTVGDDPHPARDWFVPAARFPLAEHCINPSCQLLVRREPDDHRPGRCETCGTRRRPSSTLQVVPVVACTDGHLDDVDWSGWLHTGQPCANPELRYQTGSAPDRPRLTCRGCSRSGAFDPINYRAPCSGAVPWLPHRAPGPCTRPSRVVERTSTAIHYAHQLSALTLPLGPNVNPELVEAFRNNPILRFLAPSGHDPRTVAQMIELCTRLGIATDADEISAYLGAAGADPTPLADQRAAELNAMTPAAPTPPFVVPPDLVVEPRPVAGYRGTEIGDRLAAVSQVQRLRETRVIAGFSRLEPAAVPAERGYEQMWGTRRPHEFPAAAQDDWFPANEVYGEGILLVLDPDVVARWETVARSSARLNAAAGNGSLRRLLAHTLAHMLLRSLAPASGYPLPAIRERIFTTDHRTGLLLYTATGDSQGTLGGLVELGTPAALGQVFRDAADRARWCAADPVCREDQHSATLGSTPGACHHCLYVPETSCEMFNSSLDRSAVIEFGEVAGWLGTEPLRLDSTDS